MVLGKLVCHSWQASSNHAFFISIVGWPERRELLEQSTGTVMACAEKSKVREQKIN